MLVVTSSLHTGSRLLALFIAPGWLCAVAGIVTLLSPVSFALALATVTGGAVVVVLILVLLSTRLVRHSGGARFSLGSVAAIFVLASIYLAAARWYVMSLTALKKLESGASLGGRAVSIHLAISVLALAFSTYVLLWFAESLVWLAVLVLRSLRRRRA